MPELEIQVDDGADIKRVRFTSDQIADLTLTFGLDGPPTAEQMLSGILGRLREAYAAAARVNAADIAADKFPDELIQG